MRVCILLLWYLGSKPQAIASNHNARICRHFSGNLPIVREVAKAWHLAFMTAVPRGRTIGGGAAAETLSAWSEGTPPAFALTTI